MPPKISRRNLLKIGALTAVTVTTPVTTLKYFRKTPTRFQEAVKPRFIRETHPTRCILCGQGCPMRVETINGIVRHAYPNPASREVEKYTAICGRPQGLITLAYNPDRLKYPLIREEGSKRGEGRFRRATWDEALDLVARKLLEIKEKYGPQAVAVFVHQGNESGAVKKLFKIFGTPNITKHSSTCHTSMDVGLYLLFGKMFGPGTFTNDYENAKLVVFVERNPYGGLVATTWAKMLSIGKKKGLRIIVIDPRFTETAEHSDLWVPIRPGTDLALLLAIINQLVRNGWYNEEFVRKYTNASMLVFKDTLDPVKLVDVDEGFFKGKKTYLVYDESDGKFKLKTSALKPSLYYEGDYEGRRVTTVFNLLRERVSQYTPEWASGITGVPVKVIVEIARQLWENAPAASIDHGYKAVRWLNEMRVFQAIMMINILIGSLGQKGGVLWNKSLKPSAPISTPKHDVESVWDYWKKNGYPLHKPGGTPNLLIKSILEEKPYPIKAAIIWNQNLIGHHPGFKEISRALEKLELVVIADVMPNETMPWADVVLPHAYFFEEDAKEAYDVKKTPIPYITIARKAQNPPYEVRPSYEILDELAKRLLTPEEYEKYWKLLSLPADQVLAKICESKNLPYDKLVERGSLALSHQPKYGEVYKSGKPFNTVTGEIELLSIKMLQLYNKHKDPLLDPLITWVEPQYMMYKKDLSEDEFVPVEGFINMQSINTFLKDSKLHVDYTKYMKAHMVWIHPKRAERLGLREGDWVEVYNPRQPDVSYKVQVHITDSVHPDALFGFHGTNPGPLLELFKKNKELRMEYTPESGFNTNFLQPLEEGFTPYWGGAMLQDFIVKIRRLGG